jgi:hypothetical protein
MRMSIIEASPHAAGTAYLAGNRYQMDDFTPYLFKTTDYGATWTPITNGIPSNEFTRAIREDLYRPGMLYAATERSMYLSYDAGRTWQSLKKNLPPVPVHDIALKDDDIAIATHGRGFWVMDSLTPLRWAPEAAAARDRAFLYRPAPVMRYNGNATIPLVYRLANASEPVKFELLDRAGRVVLSTATTDTAATPCPGGRGGGGGGGFGGGGGGAGRPSNRAGLNKFSWNLRHGNAVTFCNMITWAGSGAGPSLPPGTYSVRMTAGSNAPITHPLIVKKDPRTEATEADLAEQTRFALQVRDRITDANQGVILIRNLKADLANRSANMPNNTEFTNLVRTFVAELSSVEDSLYQTKNQSGQDPLNYPIRLNDQLGGLLGFIGSADRRPPKQAYDVYTVLNTALTRELSRLNATVARNLPRVNTMLRAANQPEVSTSKVERRTAPTGPGGGTG